MTPNPFAPPAAEVADIPEDNAPLPPYFAVSLLKLALLSLFTLGLYELYWFYSHWRVIKRREDSSVWPVPRAIFAIFFCHSLFKHIRRSELQLDIEPTLSAGLLATGWILVTIAYKLPAPYELISYFAVLFLLPAQAHANRVNAERAPSHDRNARFTAWNWVAIVVGGIFLLLVLVGTFVPVDRNSV